MNQREPILNLPGIVTLLAAAIIAIHAIRVFLLDDATDVRVLLTFAFIPARFEASLAASWGYPGSPWADVTMFVTYAFLHGDWAHVAINVLWLAVFGSAVARRFGTARTLALFAIGSVAGAAAHLAAHGAAQAPMIGASAAVSALTAAALRFVFQWGGPLRQRPFNEEEAFRVPALPLAGMVRNGLVMGIIAIWLVTNVLFGAISLPIPGAEGQIAWQAHLGGFLAGLLLFGLIDPVRQDEE